ncbi:MAG: GspJ family T2SS minor pseudopilin variant XcpW [Gammaproteobacteria bacterium]|nr:MAG: GspJ family T2SS minor pseudopilin variant XcpW [Gammaproteobacteria bacterium]
MYKQHLHGFTLLELLVAMTVFSIMAVMAYGGLAQVIDGREALTQIRNEQRVLVMAMMRMEDDLGQIRQRKVRALDGSELAAFIGRAPDTRALAEPSLEFTRAGVTIFGDIPQSDLQRVGYKLDDEQHLIRVSWPVLDRAPSTKAHETVLLSGVQEVNVRFYAPGGKWVNTWPPLGTNNLTDTVPPGIEITFTVGDREITRVWAIHG